MPALYLCFHHCACLSHSRVLTATHDDVIKWNHFSRYWPFLRRIYRSPVNFPHKGRWRGALMLSLTWINGWVNNCETGDLRRRRAHYDVTVMIKHVYLSDQLASLSHVQTCIYNKHNLHENSIHCQTKRKHSCVKDIHDFAVLLIDAKCSWWS